MASISETLIIARQVKRISVAELAEQTGLSQSTIDRIEKGEEPNYKTARKLSGWLGICLTCQQPIEMPPVQAKTEALPFDDNGSEIERTEIETNGPSTNDEDNSGLDSSR